MTAAVELLLGEIRRGCSGFVVGACGDLVCIATASGDRALYLTPTVARFTAHALWSGCPHYGPTPQTVHLIRTMGCSIAEAIEATQAGPTRGRG